MTIEQYIASGLWLTIFVFMFLFWQNEKEDLIRGFKGSNGEWESEEVIPLVWFILTPLIMFCVLVLGFTMSSFAWAAYNAIGVIAFGAKVYLNTHEKK
jgi:hypothetical protein